MVTYAVGLSEIKIKACYVSILIFVEDMVCSSLLKCAALNRSMFWVGPLVSASRCDTA